MGVAHAVDDAVGGGIGLGLEAEVEHVSQPVLLLQHRHVAVGGLREVAAAHEHARAHLPSVLHDEHAHIAGILYAFIGDGTLRVGYLG